MVAVREIKRRRRHVLDGRAQKDIRLYKGERCYVLLGHLLKGYYLDGRTIFEAIEETYRDSQNIDAKPCEFDGELKEKAQRFGDGSHDRIQEQNGAERLLYTVAC